MKTKTSERPETDTAASTAWMDVVRQKVGDLRFGSVQIIVHEGRVTQVESLEKTRFPASSREESGATA